MMSRVKRYTVQRRFSSFKISAECNDVNEMYDPDLWPEGALVRRYYEPRRVGGSGATLPSAENVRARNGTAATH